MDEAKEAKAFLEDTTAKFERKFHELMLRHRGEIPAVAKDGRYDNRADADIAWSPDNGIAWWTNGFWGGIMNQLYALTGKKEYLDEARASRRIIDGCFLSEFYYGLHHDVGFMWLPTAVADYMLTKDDEARRRGLMAAQLLAGRYNSAGRFIRAWNDPMEKDSPSTKGWAIIDCMLNISLLYWASEELGDPRYRTIAENHAETTMRNFVRPDGSVRHIVEFDPETGERVRSHGGQGYGRGSSWTRGQGWGIYGFMLSYIHTGEKRYLDTAIKIANYFIVNTPPSGLIPVDFRQPAEPAWEDSTAAAIAACGMIEISKAVEGNDSAIYREAAVRMLKALDEKRSNWDADIDNIIEKGTVAYHYGAHETGILYGDFYFIEALMKLAGIDYMPW